MNKKLRALFLLSLIAISPACIPSKHSIVPQLQLSKISALTESDSQCELKLKSYIQKHGINFVSTTNLTSEVDLANKIAITNSDEKLDIREQKAQFIEYQHSSSFKINASSVERTSTLGLNKKDSFYLMYFETALKTKTLKLFRNAME